MGVRIADVVGFAGDRSPLLESFRTLRSTLQYFNVDGNLRKILVTSGLPQEGKTVTTVNLAISLAMSGKRVIVLEADLRRPMVHEYLGLANEVGLSNVLAGSSSVPAALQLVSMDSFIPARSRKGENGHAPLAAAQEPLLHHFGATASKPGGVAAVRSHGRHCAANWSSLADYVLVDTPPVLPVSDAVALAPNVDAVILTARLNSTTRDEIAQVRGLLEQGRRARDRCGGRRGQGPARPLLPERLPLSLRRVRLPVTRRPARVSTGGGAIPPGKPQTSTGATRRQSL